MRILNLIWKFGEGGIAKCFLTYAAMGDADRHIHVVSACIDPQNCDYDRSALRKIGVQIIPIKTIRDFSWMPKTHKLIKEVKPDVIFCHGFNGPVIVEALRLRYNLDIPMVCSYHGLYYAPTKGRRWLAPVFNGLMLMLYEKRAKKIIVVSYYSKHDLIDRGIDDSKLAVVHNGIKDIELKPMKRNDGKLRIGVVSRLDPFKGIDILIDALQIIKQASNIPFTLDVVGSGPMEKMLRLMVCQKELDKVVNFAGYQTDIPSWMDRWDIFCLPSFFENHSLSILEAMRSGKPIVTTQVGGNEESVTDGKEALTVPAKDAGSLAKALLRLMQDSKLRETLGRNARERFVNEFTEDVMKRNLARVFSTLS